MIRRRPLLANVIALSVPLAGCSGRSNTSNRTTERASDTPTATTTSTGNASTSETPDPTTSTTELNRTLYPVAWQWDLSNVALGDGREPRLSLLTIDDWRSRVEQSVLATEARTFVSETDFGSETVVAFETWVSAGYNRLILHSIDGVGTSTVTLAVEEWESGSGLNNAPLHLLLVRVPNRGTEPTEAKVHVETGEETVTVSTDD